MTADTMAKIDFDKFERGLTALALLINPFRQDIPMLTAASYTYMANVSLRDANNWLELSKSAKGEDKKAYAKEALAAFNLAQSIYERPSNARIAEIETRIKGLEARLAELEKISSEDLAKRTAREESILAGVPESMREQLRSAIFGQNNAQYIKDEIVKLRGAIQKIKDDIMPGIEIIQRGAAQAEFLIDQPELAGAVFKMLEDRGGRLSIADIAGIALGNAVPGAQLTHVSIKAMSEAQKENFEKAFAAIVSVSMPKADKAQVINLRNNYISALEWIDIAKEFAQDRDYRSAVAAFNEARALDESAVMDGPTMALAHQWHRQAASQEMVLRIESDKKDVNAWIDIAKDYALKGDERSARAALREAEHIGGRVDIVIQAKAEIPRLIQERRVQNVKEANEWLAIAGADLRKGNFEDALFAAAQAMKASRKPEVILKAQSVRQEIYRAIEMRSKEARAEKAEQRALLEEAEQILREAENKSAEESPELAFVNLVERSWNNASAARKTVIAGVAALIVIQLAQMIPIGMLIGSIFCIGGITMVRNKVVKTAVSILGFSIAGTTGLAEGGQGLMSFTSSGISGGTIVSVIAAVFVAAAAAYRFFKDKAPASGREMPQAPASVVTDGFKVESGKTLYSTLGEETPVMKTLPSPISVVGASAVGAAGEFGQIRMITDEFGDLARGAKAMPQFTGVAEGIERFQQGYAGNARLLAQNIAAADKGEIRIGQTVTIKDTVSGKTIVIVRREDGAVTVNGKVIDKTSLIDIIKSYGFAKGYSRDSLPYELSYTVLRNGSVLYSDEAEIIFGADGSIISMSCTDVFDGIEGSSVEFRGHTHPYAHDMRTEEFSEDILAIRARAEIFGRYIPEIIRIKDADGRSSMIMLWHDTASGSYYVTGRPAPLSISDKDISFTIVKKADGYDWEAALDLSKVYINVIKDRAVMNVTRYTGIPTPLDTRLKKELRGLLSILKDGEFIMRVSAKGLKDAYLREIAGLEAALRVSGPSGRAMSYFALVDRLARLLNEAGIYASNFGVVVDARKGAYSGELIAKAMKEAVSPDSPVKYAIVVESEEYAARIKAICADTVTIVVPEGQDAAARVAEVLRGDNNKVMGNSYIAIATTEANAGFVISHYAQEANKDPNGRFNSLVTKEDIAADSTEAGKVPAGALLTILLKLVSKNETTVMTIGCSDSVIKNIQDALKSGFRLFKLAKLEIERIIGEFLSALNATAKSL